MSPVSKLRGAACAIIGAATTAKPANAKSLLNYIRIDLRDGRVECAYKEKEGTLKPVLTETLSDTSREIWNEV